MAIAFSQKIPNTAGPDVTTSGTSLTSTAFTSNQNYLVVAVAWSFHASGGPALGAAQFVDSKSNAWTLAKEALYLNYTGTTDLSIHIFYAVMKNFGASHTITAQNFPSSSEISLMAVEFSGTWDNLALSTGNSTTTTGTGAGIHLISGSINPSGSSLLYIGSITYDDLTGNLQTLTNNWASSTTSHSLNDFTWSTGLTAYRISSGSQQADVTTTGTGTKYGLGAIAAFAEQAAAGSYPVAWTKA